VKKEFECTDRMLAMEAAIFKLHEALNAISMKKSETDIAVHDVDGIQMILNKEEDYQTATEGDRKLASTAQVACCSEL
jgi:hypothetical protein